MSSSSPSPTPSSGVPSTRSPALPQTSPDATASPPRGSYLAMLGLLSPSPPTHTSAAADQLSVGFESQTQECGSGMAQSGNEDTVFQELHDVTVRAAKRYEDLRARNEALEERLKESETEKESKSHLAIFWARRHYKNSAKLHERIDELETQVCDLQIREEQASRTEDAIEEDNEASRIESLTREAQEWMETAAKWRVYAESLEADKGDPVQEEACSIQAQAGRNSAAPKGGQDEQQHNPRKSRKARKKGGAQENLRKALQEEREQESALHASKLEALRSKVKSQNSHINELESEIKRLTNSEEYYKHYYDARPERILSGLIWAGMPKPDPVKVEIEQLRILVDKHEETIAKYARAEAGNKNTIDELKGCPRKFEGEAPEPVHGPRRQMEDVDEEEPYHGERKWMQRRGKWVPQ